MCEEMDSDFDILLYYTHIQWLSKGKVVEFILLILYLNLIFNTYLQGNTYLYII